MIHFSALKKIAAHLRKIGFDYIGNDNCIVTETGLSVSPYKMTLTKGPQTWFFSKDNQPLVIVTEVPWSSKNGKDYPLTVYITGKVESEDDDGNYHNDMVFAYVNPFGIDGEAEKGETWYAPGVADFLNGNW